VYSNNNNLENKSFESRIIESCTFELPKYRLQQIIISSNNLTTSSDYIIITIIKGSSTSLTTIFCWKMKRERDSTISSINSDDNASSSNGVVIDKVETPTLKSNDQPAKKRKLQFGQSANLHGSQNTRIFEHFRQLDPSNPTEAKRIQTRHKQILKGKNTVGYDIYSQKVPKNKRKKIAEHPSTPDYKADIPNRRWLGLLKAWRKSMHQYDPNDIMSDLDSEVKRQNPEQSNVAKISLQPKPENAKEKQIKEASSMGLPVDFTGDESKTTSSIHGNESCEEVANFDNEIEENNKFCDDQEDELDRWEAERINADGDDLLLDYDDSDDDLL
jgi:hypothetical protein